METLTELKAQTPRQLNLMIGLIICPPYWGKVFNFLNVI